jgi:hypothetical protein
MPHGLGGWEAPGIFQFEPGNFLRLYQTAHSESALWADIVHKDIKGQGESPLMMGGAARE